MDVAECSSALEDYVGALEEERRKIQMFQRELPLCLQLVTQTIESVRQQMQAEASVAAAAATMAPPVLEEFLPLKPSLSSPSHDEEEGECEEGEDKAENKPDWLRSVQLWNQTPEKSIEKQPQNLVAVKKSGGGAFQPFDREKRLAATSSSAETATSNSGEKNNTSKEKQKEAISLQQQQRKVRRCWSPELHRRFINALQQLGGSHSTPKQIRDLMKVDGLTNDEVKSHLQKYRLHTRRSSPTAPSNSSSMQTSQFVVVGGIWVPSTEYAAAATVDPSAEGTPAGIGGVYAPVASTPSDLNLKNTKQIQRFPAGPLNSPGRGCSEDNVAEMNSASPATSSQTTTSSPPF